MDPYLIWGTGEQDDNLLIRDSASGIILQRKSDGRLSIISALRIIKIRDGRELILKSHGFHPERMASH